MKIRKSNNHKNSEYELVIDNWNHKYPVENNNGYYFAGGYLDDPIPLSKFKEISSSKVPKNTFIYLHSDNFTRNIFGLSGIGNHNNELFIDYYCDFRTIINNENIIWSAKLFCDTLEKESQKIPKVKVQNSYNEKEISESFTFIKIKFDEYKKIELLLADCEKILKQLYKDVTSVLSGLVWKKEYESNEAMFSKEIIHPLLLKMKLKNVVYNHGPKEYGKDFTFNDVDKFGQRRNYGIQVKAGNVSGKVNGEIDELIGQIKDSFEMPYLDINSQSPNYISTLIIVISGSFTQNAKEKILIKVNYGLHGSIYFIDKQKVIELLNEFWN